MAEPILDLFAVDLDKDEETLARWFDTFNSWGWPEDFQIPKPDVYDEPSFDRHKFIWPVMSAIKDKIGDKVCLRYHWIHNLNRTEEQFEEFYQNPDEYYRLGRDQTKPLDGRTV